MSNEKSKLFGEIRVVIHQMSNNLIVLIKILEELEKQNEM